MIGILQIDLAAGLMPGGGGLPAVFGASDLNCPVELQFLGEYVVGKSRDIVGLHNILSGLTDIRIVEKRGIFSVEKRGIFSVEKRGIFSVEKNGQI